MITKCELCQTKITKQNGNRCEGLMCPKIYCNTCYNQAVSMCSTCSQTLLCPLCVMVWDICPSCLDKDNAVVFEKPVSYNS